MAKFCGRCGAKLDQETGLCPNCDLCKQKKREKSDKRKRSKAFTFILIGIVLTLFIGSTAVIIVLHRQGRMIPGVSTILQAIESLYNPQSKQAHIALQGLLSNDSETVIVNQEGDIVNSIVGGKTSQKILESIEFTVLETEEEESGFKSRIRFDVPDIVGLLDTYASVENVQENFSAWVLENLESEFPTINMEIIVHFQYQEDGIAVVADEELYNVLTGGALNYYVETQENAYQSQIGDESR